MSKKHVQLTEAEKAFAPQPEIDRSPKTYSRKEMVLYGLKMGSVFALIFFALWLLDKVNL